jgi:asparagine synthase (glutamine-hydrolysing)
MCGLVGIYNLGSDKQPARQELATMVEMLRHRGPDGYGLYLDEAIGLGHARLAIIDLDTGAQPIHNEDRTVWVVFNGEIFNFIELRRDLAGRGHVFYTQSDTEVLVHLYEEYGDDFVHHLNGQFAIALWDAPRHRLLLVRDRAGILPLFYAEHDKRLLFGSEIKSILPMLGGAPRLNPSALDQVMTFWSALAPETLFEGIRELAPGEMLIAEGGCITRRRYWSWSYPVDGDYFERPEEDLAAELHDLLVDATRLRLRADVPVGAYLSGGFDSSAIAALVHHYGGVPLRTFSLGFEDRALDEGEFQRALVRHIGAEHSEIQCRDGDIAARFLDTVWMTETPILRTAPVPMGMLSGAVRAANFRVVLTGEGADEVFGGYDIFKEAKIRAFWARFPQSTRRPALLKRLYPYLDLSQRQTLIYLQSFFGLGIDTPDAPHFSHIPRWTTTSRCKEFFSAELRMALADDAVARLLDRLPPEMPRWHRFHRAQYLEAVSLLPGYLLSSQGDRMLMSNSVEGRFPYLDHRVIEFANRLHPRLKMKVLREKHILKRAVGRYLPDAILNRLKQPYRAPDSAAFFHGELPEYARELLSADALRRYGYFDAAKVQRLLEKIRRNPGVGYKDNMAFVGILSTQAWHYLFVERYSETFLNRARTTAGTFRVSAGATS